MNAQSGPARAVLDGAVMALEDARLPVTDDGVARGDGVFETVGVFDGRPFRLAQHLDRLARSLAAVGLPPCDRAAIETDAAAALTGCDRDAALRIYVTGSGRRVLTLTAMPDRLPVTSLEPQPAPWIRPVAEYPAAGAKTMSYGPNMVATRSARAAGADDALLLSTEGFVLEGPTFAVCWVADGGLRAPDRSLGVVDSISRRTLFELAAAEGLPVSTGRWALTELGAADEVMISSALRDATAVRRIGDLVLDGATPVCDRLGARLRAARRQRS